MSSIYITCPSIFDCCPRDPRHWMDTLHVLCTYMKLQLNMERKTLITFSKLFLLVCFTGCGVAAAAWSQQGTPQRFRLHSSELGCFWRICQYHQDTPQRWSWDQLQVKDDDSLKLQLWHSITAFTHNPLFLPSKRKAMCDILNKYT